MFASVVELANRKQFDEIPKLLKEFRNAFNAHLLLENVKLYIYLKQCLANEADSLEVMTEIKIEMQAIGKTVSKFLKKYTIPDWTEEMKADFSEELSGIGSVLTERIDNEEESLYSLYMSPSNY